MSSFAGPQIDKGGIIFLTDPKNSKSLSNNKRV
jgi:hypothetical protein